MKRKLTMLVCVAGIGLGSTASLRADSGGAMVADLVVGRPACLVATAVGSVFFVLSLPFAYSSRSVDSAAHALVITPARATFRRPLGDFGYLSE